MGSRDPITLLAYRKGAVLYVRMAGSLTMLNFEEALETFNQLLSDPPEVFYVMIRNIRYLDSAGLGMFVKLNTRCRSSKIKLSLLDPSQEVIRLFNLSKMDLIMPIERGENIHSIRGEYEIEDYAIDVGRPN